MGAPLRYITRQSIEDYADFEALADQAGAGAVLIFTFSKQVQYVWVQSRGDECRAIPLPSGNGLGFSSQVPTASLGVICSDGVPTPMIVDSLGLQIFAPVTATRVSVWGYRFA